MVCYTKFSCEFMYSLAMVFLFPELLKGLVRPFVRNYIKYTVALYG